VTARSVALFIAAAFAEIGGAYLVWVGIKQHRGIALIAEHASQGAALGQRDEHGVRRLCARTIAAAACSWTRRVSRISTSTRPASASELSNSSRVSAPAT
jgi:threonine/homoserine/homoserine lactone efflux protein